MDKRARTVKRIKVLMLSIVVLLSYMVSCDFGWITPINVLAQERSGTLTGTNVNVRTGPGTSYDKTGIKLSTGDKVTIVDTVNTSDAYAWYQIKFYKDGVYYEGYITSQYVSIDPVYDYDANKDFEEYMNEQSFPESYKAGLREIHEKYPQWVFIADHNNYDWTTVVEGQKAKGRSLIHNSAASSWKSLEDGAYNWETGEWIEWDSGNWVMASEGLIKYALDPRNFLNTTNIFMFELLSYNLALQNKSGVEAIIANTFMESTGTVGDGTGLYDDEGTYTYAEALIKAGMQSGVSPYHLATRIIQEIGSNGASNSISGTVSGYRGYYNYFNQGAYKTSDTSAIINGLKYASRSDSNTLRPWNTRMKSIVGGSIKLGSDYIGKGQDTLYYEKFDLISQFTHQYMTNILAPKSESITAAKGYSEDIKQSTSLVFKIPIYQNMPENACECPTGNGSPNNALRTLGVDGYSITPSFDYSTSNYSLIVDNNVSSINISAESMVSSADISGAGYKELSVGKNTFDIDVTAGNGEIRTYTITVYRKESQVSTEQFSTSYKLDTDNNRISSLSVGSTAADAMNNITFSSGYSGKIVNRNGNDMHGIIGTGDRLLVYNSDNQVVSDYAFVIYGDVNGDGYITSLDMLYLKRHVLDVKLLEDSYLAASDANRDQNVTSLDIVYIKRHVLDVRYINQN